MSDFRRGATLLWLVFVGFVVTAIACGSSNDAVDRAALASGCILDSDCVSPLRCAFKTCHEECAQSVDCVKDYGPNARCVVADRPFNVCQLPSEASCNYNTDCPTNERCASDRECRDECKGDIDCVNGQVCITGVCAEPKELVNGTLPPPADGGVLPNDGQECLRPSDCVAPLTCLSGHCTYECKEDRDCQTSQKCSPSHTCVPIAGSCVPATCASLGKQCGVILDGCGATATCTTSGGAMSDCGAGQVCGGGGPNTCGTTTCVPKTCAQLGNDCGLVSDGCSGVLNCGVCPSGKSCGGSGTANKCGCVADNTAACAGKQCGPTSNNCQDTIDCGACNAGTTCGLLEANQCGCAKKTCAQLGYQCGTGPDGCGGTLDCGSCTVAGQNCGGGGTPNQCAAGSCTPKTCQQLSKNCGTVSNGCNATLDCGTCTVAGQTCGGSGTANLCGCLAKTCDQLNAACGMIDNGCGTMIPCGSCTGTNTCGGGGSPNHCGCAPTTCAAQGKNCGTIGDGCGGTLTCGTCTGTQICGATGLQNVCGTPGPTPSCNGQASTCGPGATGGTDDCCRSEAVTGTTDPLNPYYMSYATASPPVNRRPILVGNFKLDVYEVTIGRYRTFAQAANTWAYQSMHPPTGAGANTNIALTHDATPQPLTWQATWNANLPTDYTNLTTIQQGCDGGLWTAAPTGGVENYPMRCVNWYEAFAFCAWDGGRLATWSEWEYAFHGGTEYRQYPWGTAAPDCAHDIAFNEGCTWPVRAGFSGLGDSKWGQRNMAGSLEEWVFDSTGAPLTPDCSTSQCAWTQTGGFGQRIIAVNSYSDGYQTPYTDGNGQYGQGPSVRTQYLGFRCARNL